MIQEGDPVVRVSSAFGLNTRRPYLIEGADWMTLMSPDNARELAMNLLEAAEAAESDGFMVHFMKNAMEIDDDGAFASVLSEFRKYREILRNQ